MTTTVMVNPYRFATGGGGPFGGHSTLPTGLLSYYPLQNDYNDSTGTSNATNNGTTLTGSGSGFFDKYADFNGSTAYVDLNHTFTNPGSQASVQLWINPDVDNAFQRIFDNATGTFANYFRALLTRAADSPARGVRIEFDDGTNNTSDDTGSYTTSSWYHVVITINNGTRTIYINGTKTQYTGTLASPYDYVGTANSILGKNGNNSANYYNGQMCHVAMWDKTLSDSEVSDLYNSGSGLAY